VSLKVIVLKNQKPIDQILVKGEIAMIGRKSDCEISIKDPAVSGNHARICEVGDQFVIEDLGSTNGIIIGGKKVKQHVLQNEDLLNIGEHQIKILISESAPPKAAVSGDSEGFIQVVKGAGAGDRIDLTEPLTTIGVPGVQVAAVSRRPQGHFIIHVDGGKNKDLFPMVNGEPTGFRSLKLEPGDQIEVAGIQMEYCMG